jgi:hypothetical protein
MIPDSTDLGGSPRHPMNQNEIVALGTESWNRWRGENPLLLPDLRGVVLRNQQLRGARFNDTILAGADLSFADLREADLSRADLRGVLLTGADLRNTNLRSAILADVFGGIGSSVVDLTDADFTGARFGWTMVGHVYLNRITGVGQIRHSGPSYISTSTLEFTAREIKKTGVIRTDVETFLRGAGILLETLNIFETNVRSHAFYSVFISYSHADKEFANWLHQKLEERGIRCWLDEKNMRPGDRILDAVGRAISSHDRVLLCCSKTSLSSWWVRDEVRKIQEIEHKNQKESLRIIPIFLDEYIFKWNNGLASDLRSRLGLDFKNWTTGNDNDRQLEKLFEALKRSSKNRAVEGAHSS